MPSIFRTVEVEVDVDVDWSDVRDMFNLDACISALEEQAASIDTVLTQYFVGSLVYEARQGLAHARTEIGKCDTDPETMPAAIRHLTEAWEGLIDELMFRLTAERSA